MRETLRCFQLVSHPVAVQVVSDSEAVLRWRGQEQAAVAEEQL